ncbi:type II 3-dehydroquinate dehydratase [Spectribacter hydrogenoxidans]|uniref:3-dehydroquinate dehydratase n=1 Tax=Spectribacter hydrogenoxidans TaxID=3075608 RepID=A0ABU3C095_9GAMM|nr:type II 3-dehydroquinate dehydratase [Salinisphaera sp. W335]MDT0634980.1 type II 3-dehydroquinate dehydratase [Salinisphaera sp. W335]
MAKILLLNGPNLNRLGQREPGLYGMQTLGDIEQRLARQADDADVEFACLQSNAEAALIERIHQSAEEGVNIILLNPAAFTHTSVALRDALLAVDTPFIEIHLSNIWAREAFRHHSYFSDIAVGVISGLGAHGYELAMQAALARLAADRA